MMTRKEKVILIIWGLAYIGIMAVMNLIWEAIDTIEFGAPQPSVADTLFGLVLAYMIVDKLMDQLKKRGAE